MTDLSDWNIGFIGLGLMGRPMARNLFAAGANMRVHNRSRGPRDELAAEGMTGCAAPAETASTSETIILMLTDSNAVDMVVRGENGILEGLRQGAVIIDMGTTKVPLTRELAAAVRAKGAEYVDAPVSGGMVGAEGGSLTIMAGGADSAIECVKPVFDVLGARFTHVGDIGAGQIAKAANQMIVGLSIGAVAEALALARAAGANPALVREALAGGFADSRILELHGRRMIDQAFEPGGRATVQLKDMNQALELGGQLGLEMPATHLNRDLYQRLVDQGDGDLDHSALIRIYGKP